MIRDKYRWKRIEWVSLVVTRSNIEEVVRVFLFSSYFLFLFFPVIVVFIHFFLFGLIFICNFQMNFRRRILLAEILAPYSCRKLYPDRLRSLKLIPPFTEYSFNIHIEDVQLSIVSLYGCDSHPQILSAFSSCFFFLFFLLVFIVTVK